MKAKPENYAAFENWLNIEASLLPQISATAAIEKFLAAKEGWLDLDCSCGANAVAARLIKIQSNAEAHCFCSVCAASIDSMRTVFDRIVDEKKTLPKSNLKAIPDQSSVEEESPAPKKVPSKWNKGRPVMSDEPEEPEDCGDDD